ncbi:thioredoxin domain-containing protein 12-like isoform X2 [Maniola jurtina]|uniref:thioredoxin domain-containing protein 12-like isoform X2 n=1 Tax=Maniola jurtina TaxID=191418 RepID=UPI001E686867|nr:thioredoxin domain-containing protein 12-like isoform X2 [Maniola jurtina]
MAAGYLSKALLALIFTKVHCASFGGSGGKDNGFGSNYVWAGSLEAGMQIAVNHKKPVMVIIHKSWCSACKNLKPKFANSNEIQSLSQHFVMVNLMDEEEPKNNKFAPDGTYIPRILFISPMGMVDCDIYNEEGSSQHKYFYSRPEQIAKSMRKVIEKYKSEQFDK